MTGVPAQALGFLGSAESAAAPSADDRRQQYEICKVRGHVATILGNMHGATGTLATLNLTADGPARKYTTVEEGAWETCFHCGTRYRWVSRLEEIRPE